MEMEELKECPGCGSTKIKRAFNCKDHFLSKEEFGIDHCQGCGLLFTNPRPNESDLSKYYESEDYISHSSNKKGLLPKAYSLVRDFAIKQKIKLLKKLHSKGQVLDIGCGTGEFLAACKKAGYKTKGVEPSEKARKFAIQNYDLEVLEEKEIQSVENEQFELITLWHVLEHVPNLNERVNQIEKMLTPGGYAIIAVPNPESFDAKLYKEDWAAWDVPRHLYHFNKESIISLFKKHRLQHTETLPMKFDSFYVSILSEKYKSGKTNYLKAFITGMTSNCKAKAPGHSSQVYIFKKN
jgi:2-polyprenyl-3-methyl-5-hydroxy-6-metoxy-1,4-benzoquinol methylase